jgi:hypothetical protein
MRRTGADIKIDSSVLPSSLATPAPTARRPPAGPGHPEPTGRICAREFWAGLETFGGAGLLRAGRINVLLGPQPETSFVRTSTQTDINQG